MVDSAATQTLSSEWNAPIEIAHTQGWLATGSLEVVADSAGGLHVFYEHNPDGSGSSASELDYMKFDGDGWSAPIDIVAAEDGGFVRHPRAAIDSTGIIHLVWVGSGNNLLYSKNHVATASDVQRWSKPVLLGDGFAEPAIVIDPNDGLHIVTNSIPEQSVVLHQSEDYGETWTYPITVFADTGSGAPAELGLALDGANRLHVVWTGHTLPSGDPLTGVYYSRSTDNGLTWSSMIELDGDFHGDINVAANGQDEIHVVWTSNIGGDGAFHSWSSDGGLTWSQPQLLNDTGGQSGLPSIVADSSGTVHILLASVHAAEWTDGMLRDYVDAAGSRLRNNSRSLERAKMVVTGGNTLHAVFENNFSELHHVIRILDSPAVEPVPVGLPPDVDIAPIDAVENIDSQVETERTSEVLSDIEPPRTLTTESTLLVATGASLLTTIVLIFVARTRVHRRS